MAVSAAAHSAEIPASSDLLYNASERPTPMGIVF